MSRLPKIYPDGPIVVVKPDQLGEKIGSIIVPEEAKRNEKFANTTGMLVKIGASADFCVFNEELERITVTPKMLPLRVLYPKNAGITFYEDTDEGRVQYEIMKETDIIAFLEEPEVPNGD